MRREHCITHMAYIECTIIIHELVFLYLILYYLTANKSDAHILIEILIKKFILDLEKKIFMLEAVLAMKMTLHKICKCYVM